VDNVIFKGICDYKPQLHLMRQDAAATSSELQIIVYEIVIKKKKKDSSQNKIFLPIGTTQS
jgi:hypothetical protein